MASARSDVRAARMCFSQEWERQTLDAFLLPLHDLGFLKREKTTFVRKAAEAVNRLDWETYTTTRRTFMMLAEDLLKIRSMPSSDLLKIRDRMYVRFMEGRIRYFQFLEQD